MSHGEANDKRSANDTEGRSEGEAGADEPTVNEPSARDETQSPQTAIAEAAGLGSRGEPGAIGDSPT